MHKLDSQWNMRIIKTIERQQRNGRNDMNKQTVATANHNREIVEITDSMGQVTYKIKQGKHYIGKTENGGYKSMKSAIEAANR